MRMPMTAAPPLGEVWSVSWNITGTVLASSGDNGAVLLWKCGLDGKWICNATIEA
jgi:nucleoporin SEH1